MPTKLDDGSKTLLGYRWMIFFILAIGYAMVYFHRVAPAVLAPELARTFGIRGAALGVLASAYFYPYAIMQLPSGLLRDSLGPRKTVTIFSLIAGVGAILLGISPTFLAATLSRVMVGLGVSVLFIPTLKILANWFERDRFVIVTGILMAMGGMGWLLASTPLAFLSMWVGWRMTFGTIGIVTLVLALLVYLVVRDSPHHLEVSEITKSKGTGSCTFLHRRAVVFQGLKQVLFEKTFWPVASWFFFTGGILFGFGGLWAGPYLMDTYDLGKAQAGNILMMIPAGMIAGSPLLGYLSEEIFRARKPILLISSSVVVAVWVFFILAVAGLSTYHLHILFFLLGMFASGIVVIGFTATKELFPTEIAGTSTGLVNLFPFAGGALFQPLIGFTLEHGDTIGSTYAPAAYRNSFVIFLLAAVLAAISALFVRETHL